MFIYHTLRLYVGVDKFCYEKFEKNRPSKEMRKMLGGQKKIGSRFILGVTQVLHFIHIVVVVVVVVVVVFVFVRGLTFNKEDQRSCSQFQLSSLWLEPDGDQLTRTMLPGEQMLNNITWYFIIDLLYLCVNVNGYPIVCSICLCL